eukprot:TRINITY_DN8388_c0_g1_i3.p1 TRINITY_DN8388_c0_g1~~TRINITY_DN8388_c0_g1_i3.p1  ORF type:complete len:867 (-),score=184.83 TRINITY_DN8388_c0_g1_i3:56-2347(-)
MPVISGAIKVTGWSNPSTTGIHQAPLASLLSSTYSHFSTTPKIDADATAVWRNGEQQIRARYPNEGFRRVETANGVSSFGDSGLKGADGYWNGAIVRIRTSHWTYESRHVGAWDADSGTITLQTNLGYATTEGYGYFIDSKLEEADDEGEWYFDSSSNYLYMYAAGGLSSSTMEMAVLTNGIQLAQNAQNVVIDGIQFEFQTDEAILLSATNDRVVVRNCLIKNQAGFAIKTDSSSNCTLQHNTMTTCNAGGIIIQGGTGVMLTDNAVTYIGQLAGYGYSGVNGAIGIQTTGSVKSASILRNTIEHTGYIGIRFDGVNNLIENNVVEYTLETMDDGGCYYTWGDTSTGHVLRGNIAGHAIGNANSTDGTWTGAHCYYFDDKSGGILVEGNTGFDCGIGVFVHNSHDDVIKLNTLYNIRTAGVEMSDDAIDGTVSDITLTDNVIVSISVSSYLVVLAGVALSTTTIKDNFYCAPFGDVVMEAEKKFYNTAWWIETMEPSASWCGLEDYSGYVAKQTLSGNLIGNPGFNASADPECWYTWPEATSALTYVSECPSDMTGTCGRWDLLSGSDTGLLYDTDTFSVTDGECFQIKLTLGGGGSATDQPAMTASLITHHSPYTGFGWSWRVSAPSYPKSAVRTAVFCADGGDPMVRLNLNQAYRDQPTLYLDNVSLVQVSTTLLDPETVVVLFTNPTNETKTVAFSGYSYKDLVDPTTTYHCHLTLDAFSSVCVFSGEVDDDCSGCALLLPVWWLCALLGLLAAEISFF